VDDVMQSTFEHTEISNVIRVQHRPVDSVALLTAGMTLSRVWPFQGSPSAGMICTADAQVV
jgi:hypothetical protein